MKTQPTSNRLFIKYRIVRKRFVKSFLRFNGWKMRGQDAPSKYPRIIFISPAKQRLLKVQLRWMRYITASPSDWSEISDTEKIDQLLLKKITVLIHWDDNQLQSQTTALLKNAKSKNTMISVCAWLSKRKVIKFHSQFKPSIYTDRDINYINRFFKFYKQI